MNTQTQTITSNATPPPDPTSELSSLLTELRSGLAQVQGLPATLRTLQDENQTLRDQVTDLRRRFASRSAGPSVPGRPGEVSDECALHIMSHLILSFDRSGELQAICPHAHQHGAIVAAARSALGITSRAAVTTDNIPLPDSYGREIRELISSYGVIRQKMTRYPIGMGTAHPPRMGTRPAFGSIAMSALIPEKSPTITFASLESHKAGGMVKLPREIEEQSIVTMGQFLANYAVKEFARMEDEWGFLADGSGPFEGVKGIVQVAREQGRSVTLAGGKTKPSDATLDDFRALRTKVNKAALSGRLSAYYLDTTWETRLPSFRSIAEPLVYQRLPDGSAILDGYPVIWTDVMTPYGTAAVGDKPLAVFGALSYWWFGEHGTPRIDTSAHVYFANDQLATRCLEEIDFDYCAPDATAALLTAAE